MRRSLALSFLCHIALVLAALALLRRPGVEPARPASVARLEVCVRPEPLPAEMLRAPPMVMARPADLPDEIEPVEPPLPGLPEIDIELGPVVVRPAFWTLPGPGLCAKLKSPLRMVRRAPAVAAKGGLGLGPRRAPRKGRSHGPRMLGAATGIEYPLRARRLGLEGAVALRLCVGLQGSVTEVEMQKSSGHPLLDEAAVAAARQWRFAVALRDGKPVVAWIRRVVRFRLTR